MVKEFLIVGRKYCSQEDGEDPSVYDLRRATEDYLLPLLEKSGKRLDETQPHNLGITQKINYGFNNCLISVQGSGACGAEAHSYMIAGKKEKVGETIEQFRDKLLFSKGKGLERNAFEEKFSL